MFSAQATTVGELTDDNFPNEQYFQEQISQYQEEKNTGMVEYYTKEHEKWKKQREKGKIQE